MLKEYPDYLEASDEEQDAIQAALDKHLAWNSVILQNCKIGLVRDVLVHNNINITTIDSDGELTVDGVRTHILNIDYPTVTLTNIEVTGAMTLSHCESVTMSGCKVNTVLLDEFFDAYLNLYLLKPQFNSLISVRSSEESVKELAEVFNGAVGLFRLKLSLITGGHADKAALSGEAA